VLAVPLVDLLLAVVRRTRARQSPFSPDKRHLHHRLLEIGHSHIRAVVIMYFWTALIAFTGVAVSLEGAGVVLGVAGGIAVLGLVALSLPRLRERRA
jgi:UDP-GlcNAc:undecaprenyl-phosphate GlcNAc-1-phosphate transferase